MEILCSETWLVLIEKKLNYANSGHFTKDQIKLKVLKT